MRKQVWYFKFNSSILGPVVSAARWAGRDYNPEKMPDYVYKALGMGKHVMGRRAVLYPGLFNREAYHKFREQWPKHWQWNRVEITPDSSTVQVEMV